MIVNECIYNKVKCEGLFIRRWHQPFISVFGIQTNLQNELLAPRYPTDQLISYNVLYFSLDFETLKEIERGRSTERLS